MIAMVKKVSFAVLTWSALTVNALSGADCVWTGGDGDGKWSTAGNWQDGKTPSVGDKVVLTGVGTVNGEINNDIGELTLSQIVFEGSEPFRLVGAAVSPAAAGSEFLKKTATVAVTNSLALKLPSGDTKVVNSADGDLVLDGDISGEGAWVLVNGTSARKVVFAGENTHTGGIREDNGSSLSFVSAAAAGPEGSTVELNGHTEFVPGEYRCSFTNRSTSTGNIYYYFPVNGDYIFHGGFTGSWKGILFLRSFKDGGPTAVSGTIVFHEGISFPDAELYPLVADNFTVKFLKPVSLRNLRGGHWNDGHTGVWEFHASNNAVPTISPSRHARLYMKTENAFSAATSISYSFSLGTGVNNAGIFDLCGFSQTFNRIFHGVNSDSGIIRSTGGAATLLLKGTQNAMTRVLVKDQVSLVWAPEDKSLVQIFSNRVHTTTGDITVTNGIFSVEGAASFANVKNIKVEKDGVFRLDTTKSGALAGAKYIQIASGGTFKVLSGATPFGEGGCMLFLEKDASFEVPAGVVCNVSKLYVDGSAVADGEYTAGSIAGLSGEGTIKVVSAPITCIWSGEGGDGKWSNAANWYLKVKPFAGDSVSLTGAGTVNGEITNDIGELALSQIVFEGSEPFRLVGAAVSPAAAGSEFLKKTATVAVTNSLALKLPSGDTKVVNSAAGDFVLDGDISGEGAWVLVNGTSGRMVVFAGENTHTGGIRDESGGMVAFANPLAAGPEGSVFDAKGNVYFYAPGEYRCKIIDTRTTGNVSYYFYANGQYDFYGKVSGVCKYTLYFFTGDGKTQPKAAQATIKFHDEFSFPEASVYSVLPHTCTTIFLKPVTLKVFTGGSWMSDIASVFEFHDTNTIANITPSYSCRLYMKKENAFSKDTTVLYDKAMSSTSGTASGILDLCGFNQVFNCVSQGTGTYKQGVIRSTDAPATLRLEGSRSAETFAALEDQVSLVWAPEDKTFVQSFKDRAHTTTGNITVTNGILSVEGSASFSKVKNIKVEKDGVFRLNTTKSGALTGLKTLTVDAGGVFEIVSGASSMTEGEVLLDIAAGGVLRIPEGTVCDFAGIKVDGAAIPSGSYTPSNCDWIEGGSVIARDAYVQEVEATWCGAAGSSSIGAAQNWEGASLPPLDGGVLIAKFAAGGDSADVDRDVDLKKLLFAGTSREFELSGSGTVSLRDGIDVSGECTNAVVSAPVKVAGNQIWNVAEGAKLSIDAPINVLYGSEKIHKTGGGNLYLNAESEAMGPFTLGSRTEDGGVVFVNVAKNAFGPASDVHEVRICGVTSSGSQGAVSFMCSSVVERPFTLDSENSYYVFALRENVTARFTKFFRATGATRLSFAENAHVICEGGATLNGWTCFSGARGAKWTFRGEQPITADYFYLRSGQEVSIETVGNTVSGIDIDDGVFTVTRPLGLNTKAMNVYLNNGKSVLSLAGEQTIGTFRLMGGGAITSAVPSLVTFYQVKTANGKGGPITNSAVRITGAVTLFKTGGELYVQDCAANTTGGIGVGEGVLRMTENAKFRDATAFLVKNEGRAELEGERLLGRKVHVDMDSTAKLKLDGAQYVEAFTLDGVEKPWGTYGAPGSGARHELECIEGPGVLTVGTTGAFLIVR